MQSSTLGKGWGSEYHETGQVNFRLWASGQQKIALKLYNVEHPMHTVGDGWFELQLADVKPGSAYQFVLADGTAVPDPASRAQQTDVNGPSLVVDPHSYRWQNAGWQGRTWEESVFYELHVGTFTPQGTLRAAMGKLPQLAELGITVIELLPLSQFGGERGWGYDLSLLHI